ncbi:MAG TPA: hypothetical protein VFX02_13795 [Gammaproteobacteria bacterium]|nr:hypothetical protein [Gammaproteobacteria bacterium]
MKKLRFLILLFLYGCAAAPAPGTSVAAPENTPCVGQVPTSVPGLAAAANDELTSSALGLDDKGGVCAAIAFTAIEPVQVYRVYDSKSGNPYGRWWSLKRPRQSREQYRASYAICPEWSALDRLISCRLKPGSRIVLGTTQSMQCKDTAYPKSSDIQVYIPNDVNTQAVYVDNCVEEEPWPLPVVVNSRESADNSAARITGSSP